MSVILAWTWELKPTTTLEKREPRGTLTPSFVTPS